MQKRASFALVVLAMLTSTWAAHAAPGSILLDQQHPAEPIPLLTLVIGSGQRIAQTVTVGLSGRLTEVWLPVGCADGKLEVEIRDVTPGGEPGDRVFKRRKIPAGLLPETVTPTFQQFRFGRSMRFAAGDQFAIVLSNLTGTCGLSPGPVLVDYVDGEGFFEDLPTNGPGWLPLGDFPATAPDLPFQSYMLVRP